MINVWVKTEDRTISVKLTEMMDLRVLLTMTSWMEVLIAQFCLPIQVNTMPIVSPFWTESVPNGFHLCVCAIFPPVLVIANKIAFSMGREGKNGVWRKSCVLHNVRGGNSCVRYCLCACKYKVLMLYTFFSLSFLHGYLTVLMQLHQRDPQQW